MDDYKAAYERQKKARARAEQLLEEKSRELYEASESLKLAYEKLKEQKTHLFHQEKLASIGLLGAGVAHEVNNPLGYIRSNLSIFQKYTEQIQNFYSDLNKEISEIDKPKPDIANLVSRLTSTHDIDFIIQDCSEMISESIDGVDQIAHIVKSLKDFSRPDSHILEDVDLNACVKTTLTLAHNQTKYKAEINTSFGDIPSIPGNPGSIGQVILNLVINACQAIESSGEIHISTYTDDRNITLQVSDNGCGIPKEKLLTIYDPFYTTKSSLEGTGLGLSVSHSIIKQHGGYISAESEVGKGTTFYVSFPTQTARQ